MAQEIPRGQLEAQDGRSDLLKIKTADIASVRAMLLKQQKGTCPLCKRKILDPVLDHDHATGAVRSTLCRNCNRFEGKVLQWCKTVPLENSELLKNLIRYWKKHSENQHGLIHPGKITKRKRRKKNANPRTRSSTVRNRTARSRTGGG